MTLETPPQPSEQTLLGGRYELTRRLGRGSSASVHEAMDTRFGRTVILKLFDSAVANDVGLRARFQQQTAKAARLKHPNIAAVLDAGFTPASEHEGSRPFVVTEPAGTVSLRTKLQRDGRLSPAHAARLARQVAAALSYAHRVGVIHADVKPENVILDQRADAAKLVDFSLSFVSARTGMVTRETIARRAAYLAPEQVQGQVVSPAADVYGLGVLLYEMVVGRPPFVGETPTATAEQRVYEQARPAGLFEPSIPPRLEAVLTRALERSPEARWTSIEEMDAALARLGPADLEPTDLRASAAASDLNRPGQRPRVRPNVSLAVPLLAGAVAIALAFYLLIPALRGSAQGGEVGPRVIVPNVVGTDLNDAEVIAKSRGFALEVVGERVTDRVHRNVVIQQGPVSGSKAGSDEPLRVTLSSGVSVPEIRGRSLENATAALSELGWKIGAVDRVALPGQPRGVVVLQHPAPGEVVPAPGELALVVSD